MSRRNNVKQEDVKSAQPDQQDLPAEEVQLPSGPQDAEPPAVTVHVLNAHGVHELAAGSLLVICSDPGFKRAGIEHERLKVYRDGELTAGQIAQMRREPKLTLVEVG
ncbi:hypothetical protein [Bombella apis]|uniref:hypothetical protein n=1 Tax=Bombella apis TaxID=1785988 RepID=UPI0024A806D8|nr:hypothetical protein [Bombella apis]